MNLTADGKLGIGTTTPAAELQVSGDVHIGSASNINSFGALQLNQTSNVDEEGIAVLSAAGGRSIRVWVDETQSYINSGNGGGGNIILNEGAGKVGIGNTNPPEALTVEGDISASGDLHIQGNINGTLSPSGNLSISSGNVVLDSGQGIDFSATANGTTGASGSVSSELLDDYEEGTWTPQWVSSGFTSLTMDIVNAHYTRVGNLVTVSAYIRTDAVSKTTAGTAYLHGLPFTPVANDYFAVTVGESNSWLGDHPTCGYLENAGSGSRIRFRYRTTANGTTNPLSSADFDTGANDNVLMFSVIYYT
jgi:hypothetical protein